MKILLAILFLVSVNLSAQAGGNFNGREIGDVVFRGLDMPAGMFNIHGAIYVGQTDKGGEPATEPFYHEVIEMTDEHGIVFGNLAAFQRSHPAYYGAFMHPSYPGMETRKDILRKAQKLMYRDDPIEYIVVSPESYAGVLLTPA